jgi:phage baseplate assembly protein W
MSQEFLGIGWKYPVQIEEPGEIALSRYEADIRQAIMIILGTAPGERVMRPEFGCGIHQYVFAPNNTHTAGLIRFQVEDALNRWEPRISLESVVVERDPADVATLLISIDYKVRATDSRFNLVYPFYLERGETQ